MSDIIKIETEVDLESLLNVKGELTLVLKHSTRCPISSAALTEFKNFVTSSDVIAAIILVVENRNISNLLAEKLTVRHESPQLFIIKDGIPLWHVSHGAITKKEIASAISRL